MPDEGQEHAAERPADSMPPGRAVPKRIPFRARLAQPSHEYRSALGKWLARGEAVDEEAGRGWWAARGC